MPKSTGKLVILKVAIGKPSVDPATLTFVRVGALRDKSFGVEWETADATADDSPDFTKEELVTFKTVTISGSGVYNSDDSSNQEMMEDHIMSPGVSTDYQPHAWVQWIFPSGRTYQGPFLFKSWKIDGPHSDVLTFNTEATSAGAVTKIVS